MIRKCRRCGFIGEECLFKKGDNLCKKCRRSEYAQNKEKYREERRKYAETHREELSKKYKAIWERDKDILKVRNKKYREDNADKEALRKKKYREENPDKVKEYSKKHWSENKEKLIEQNRKYRMDNPEKEKARAKEYYWSNRELMLEKVKKYREENPDKIKAYGIRYRNEHREQLMEYREKSKDRIRRYRETHKDQYNSHIRDWIKTTPGQEWVQRKRSKRRQLGHEPINEWFKGSEAHHLRYSKTHEEQDNNLTIYAPRKLHRSISHNGNTGKNMREINMLLLEWYLNETPEEERNPKAVKLYWNYCILPEPEWSKDK